MFSEVKEFLSIYVGQGHRARVKSVLSDLNNYGVKITESLSLEIKSGDHTSYELEFDSTRILVRTKINNVNVSWPRTEYTIDGECIIDLISPFAYYDSLEKERCNLLAVKSGFLFLDYMEGTIEASEYLASFMEHEAETEKYRINLINSGLPIAKSSNLS